MISEFRSLEEEELIEHLVVLTGPTEDQAVIHALRRELAFITAVLERPTSKQILDGAEQVRRHLKLPLVDHGDLLYDEHGLPR